MASSFWTTLSLKNCLPDSPAHRKDMAVCEEAAGHLEGLLKGLIKLSKQVVDTGKHHNDKLSDFADELYRFGTKTSDGDPILESTLMRFSQVLKEIERSRRNLHELFATMFVQPLELFVDDELAAVKESKRKFETSSDNLDNTLEKYMSKKYGDVSIPEVAKEVSDARQQFHVSGITHCMKLNALRDKRRFDILENVLSLMYNFKSFYHQGYELLKDLDPEMKSLTDFLDQAKKRHIQETKEQEKQQARLLEHSHVYNPMSKGIIDNSKPIANQTFPDLKPGEKITKAGYLFKKNQVQRMRTTWSRRYFAVKNDLLVYSHRKGTEQVIAMNLRYSTVKSSEHNDRRFCFDIISPQKAYTLQAENEEDMHSWIEALQRAIGQALHSSMPPSNHGTTGSKERLSNENLEENFTSLSPESTVASKAMDDQKAITALIRNVTGNTRCCDCRTDDPEWASISLGIVLCIECSGIHRSLGVHISKVRSLTLDKWEPEIVQVMLQLGNENVNAIFESISPTERITGQTDRPTREKWITSKYVHKEFVTPYTPKGVNLHQKLWEVIHNGNLAQALQLLANGANIDWHHPFQYNRTSLHDAILRGDDTSAEFLLQWQCSVDEIDADGCIPLHYCGDTNNPRLTVRLLKRGAKWDIKNKEGQTPLDSALAKANVQVVTMLRLFTFNNEQTGNTSTKFGFHEALNNISTSIVSTQTSTTSSRHSEENSPKSSKIELDGRMMGGGELRSDKSGISSQQTTSIQKPSLDDGGLSSTDARSMKRRSVMDVDFQNPWQ